MSHKCFNNITSCVGHGSNKPSNLDDVKAYIDSQRLAYVEHGEVIYDGPLTPEGGDEPVAIVPEPLIVGQNYEVKLDSGTYIGVCKTFDGMPYIGNLALVGGENIANTGENYIIATPDNNGSITLAVIDSNNGSHCTITKLKIHKIDSIYFPGLQVPVVDIVDTSNITDEENAALLACSSGPI